MSERVEASSYIAVSVSSEHVLSRRQFLGAGLGMLAASVFPDLAQAQSASLDFEHQNQTTEPLVPRVSPKRVLNLPLLAPELMGGDSSAEDFVTAGGADVMTVWAPVMKDLMPNPGDVDASQWEHFDKNYAAATATGMDIIVAFSSVYPPYVFSKAHPKLHIVADRVIEGHIARFHRTVYERMVASGLPLPAALVPSNEFNYYYPYNPKKAEHAADIAISADQVFYDLDYRGALLHLAATDVVKDDSFGNRYEENAMKYLATLGWVPLCHAGVARHNYRELTHGSLEGTMKTIDLIDQYWMGNLPYIFYTEGGYLFKMHQTKPGIFVDNLPVEAHENAQKNHFNRLLASYTQTGRVASIAQYTLREAEDGDKGWDSAFFRADNTARPVVEVWNNGFGRILRHQAERHPGFKPVSAIGTPGRI